jgi:hypothetical protein
VSIIYNQVLFHWQDVNGGTATSFMPTQDQSDDGGAAYAALADAAQGCCDARIVAVQYMSTLLTPGAATTGDYQTVWDRGVLFGRNSVTNKSQRNVLVGPKSGIFLPGNLKIDLTNSLVMAYMAEVQAFLGDAAGNPSGPFYRGIRQEASGS